MKPVKVTIVLEVDDGNDTYDVEDAVEGVLGDYLDGWDITELYAEEME